MSKKQQILAFSVLLAVFLAAGALLIYLFQGPSAPPGAQLSDNAPPPPDAAPLQAPEPEEESVEKKFEAALNAMLRDVNERVGEYKLQRKVLAEMIRPENLRLPAYVHDNYKLFQTLKPSMLDQMDAVMGVFARADEDIKALAAAQPADAQAVILQEWRDLKQEQAQPYIEFFILEEELLGVYEELIGFYAARTGSFRVDVESGNVTFLLEQDQNRANGLLRRIDLISQKQKQVLRGR